MGLLLSRKKYLTKKEILEGLENDITQLAQQKQRNVYQEKSFIAYLLLLSFVSYLLGALVFYLYYSPQSWLEYCLYSIPLVLFPIIVYLVKKLLNMYFAHKKAQYDQQLTTLRAEKRKVLNEVMESETFNVARELLQRYDPGNAFLRQTRSHDRSHDATPSRRQQNGGSGVRQRLQAQTPHPALLRQQPHPLAPQTVPRPSSQPHPLPSLTAGPPQNPSLPPNPATHVASQQPLATGPSPQQPLAGPTPQQLPSHHTTQFIPPGMCLGPAPGPPTPSPILPRDRTSLDKMVEYLVGDGPNNRYALICASCHSHNGMALGDEFEYISFRCAYCFTLNPARRRGKSSLLRRTSTPAGEVVSAADPATPPAVAGAMAAAGDVPVETNVNEENEEDSIQQPSSSVAELAAVERGTAEETSEEPTAEPTE